MYYDGLGRIPSSGLRTSVKTVNPDDSEQRVYFGDVQNVSSPQDYLPSPWVRFSYDANDLAGVAGPSNNNVPSASHYTPKSEIIDTLGRVKQSTEHNAQPSGGGYEDVIMTYNYDIKGQLLTSIDPYNRIISENKYDTAGNLLRSTHIDRGEQTLVVDAQGLPISTNDAKGAQTATNYDNLNRPTHTYTRDKSGEQIVLRMVNSYGDNAGLSSPESHNLKGVLYQQYDGAGRVELSAYDFKGNLLEKKRRVLKDTVINEKTKLVVNWDKFVPTDLAATSYNTNMAYDALNRTRIVTYPQDQDGQRREAIPTYNRGGALQSMLFNDRPYIDEIAYNARGQRILIASGSLMQRYTYDMQTFRLTRTEAQKYTKTGNTYAPTGGIRLDRAYGYDLMGSVVSEKDRTPKNADSQGPGNLDRTFTHDPLRRLIRATGRENKTPLPQPTWDLNVRPENHNLSNTYTRRYAYDKLGNIKSLAHAANSNPGSNFNRTYNYATAFTDNQLESFTIGSNTYQYQYDANGNQVKENTDRYFSWNFADKLCFFKRQAGNSNPSLWAHYFYNASGQRIKKVVNKPGKIQEVTIYIDGIYEHSYIKVNDTIDNDRNYNTLHVLDAENRIATLRVGKDSTDATPELKYYVSDQVGNCSVSVEANGNRFNMEEYYPFGETSYGSFAKKRYRYNGKEKDEESGLYEYGQRYYAPWLCRFVSVDPIAEDYPQLSSYNYAGNKPITSADIEGLQSQVDKPEGKDVKTGSGGNVMESNIQRADNTAVHNTDASSDPRLIQESMEAEKAFIDKFGFAPLPKKVIESGQILKEIKPPLRSGGKEISEMIDKMKVIIPEFEGEREKTDHGGYTLTKEGATKSNNSGLEGQPSGNKDVTGLSEAMKGVRNPLKPASGSIDFTKKLLGKASGIIQADTGEGQNNDYDFPLPNNDVRVEQSGELENTSQQTDSIIVTIKSGEELRQSVRDTINGVLRRPWINGWMQTDTIINVKPIYK